MTRIIRSLMALMMAAMLLFTAQSMAVARGAPVAAGEMVICSGGGIVTVKVDADGNPVEPAHICPDCAMSLFDIGVEGDLSFPIRQVLSSETITPATGRRVSFERIDVQARGPPVA